MPDRKNAPRLETVRCRQSPLEPMIAHRTDAYVGSKSMVIIGATSKISLYMWTARRKTAIMVLLTACQPLRLRQNAARTGLRALSLSASFGCPHEAG